MAKVLCIEIGNSLVKIVETDLRAKNPKVYQQTSFMTPKGALNDGQLVNTMELGSQLRQVLLDKKIKTKQTIFTLTSSKIASREITLPNVKENKIDGLIKMNSSEYFPIDVSQYELAYQHIAMEGEGENLHRKGIVLAAPQNLLDGYIALAKECGLNVIAFDYSSNSMYQIAKNRCQEGIEMVIKVDEMVTMLTIFEDGVVALQRSISYGIDDAIDTLKNSGAFGVTDYSSALSLMRKKVVIKRTLEYPQGEESATDQIKTQVTMSLDNLMRGIMRVVDFYQTRNQGKKITKGYLTGLGGDISGLSKLMGAELGFNVVDLVKVDGFDIEHNFPDGNFGEFICSFGSAIAPLGFMGERSKDKKGGAGFTAFELNPAVGGLVLLLCLVISGIWLFMTYTPYKEAKDRNVMLRRNVDSLTTSVTSYREYTATKQAYDYLQAMDDSTELATSYLVEFIEELEEKMPSTFFIGGLQANNSGFTMDVTVNTKQEVAAVLEQLRTFDCIGNISINGIADVRDLLLNPEDVSKDLDHRVFKNETGNDDGTAKDAETATTEVTEETQAVAPVEGKLETTDGVVTFTITGSFRSVKELDAIRNPQPVEEIEATEAVAQ